MPPTSRKSDDDKAKSTRDEQTVRQVAQPTVAEPAPVPPIMAPDVILGVDPDVEDGAYADAAADLAAAARETAEKIRKQLTDLREHYDGVQKNTPSTTEGVIAAGVGRIPMAVGEVERALEGLLMASAELASRAVR